MYEDNQTNENKKWHHRILMKPKRDVELMTITLDIQIDITEVSNLSNKPFKGRWKKENVEG